MERLVWCMEIHLDPRLRVWRHLVEKDDIIIQNIPGIASQILYTPTSCTTKGSAYGCRISCCFVLSRTYCKSIKHHVWGWINGLKLHLYPYLLVFAHFITYWWWAECMMVIDFGWIKHKGWIVSSYYRSVGTQSLGPREALSDQIEFLRIAKPWSLSIQWQNGW